MSWNPMMGPLGAMQGDNPLVQALGKLQQNTLGGGGVTLGNQQGQQDYAQQMADALARMKSASSQQSLAESMMTPEYVQNSGLLGSLAMMAQAYAGKKIAGRASKEDAAAREAYYKGQSAAEQEKARKEAEKAQAEVQQRMEQGRQSGLDGTQLAEYAYTGKWPEAVRNVPMMTDQGLVNVNPYTGEYAPVQPQGASGQVNVHGDVPPAVAAAIKANPAAFEAGQQFDTSGGTMNPGAPQAPRPLMPYRDPVEAARQAAADARANAQLGLAYRAADRADSAEARTAEMQARAAEEKRAAAARRQESAAQAANDLISAIDSLVGVQGRPDMPGMPGFSNLGTVAGDLATKVPLLRNETKDAQAALENISGQVALSTMERLRALSSQGATGFGALSAPELKLLQNSIAALQSGELSNKSLKKNLKTIRDTMRRTVELGSQQLAPAASGGWNIEVVN